MKRVDAKFVKAEVANYIPREDTVEIRILVDDGKPKAFSKNLKVLEPGLQAEQLLKEVRSRLKQVHQAGMSPGDDPLSGIVHIRWLQDDDEVHERLARFLATVKEKTRNAMRQQASYYDLRQRIAGLQCVF
jgi:hypothetical protein